MPLDNSAEIAALQAGPTSALGFIAIHDEYVMVPLSRPWPRDINPTTDTCIVTSPCERDLTGAAIIPFPGPSFAEILELRALSNDKSYAEEDRQRYSQIANIMEAAMTERPEPVGNGAPDDGYDAPGEPSSREDIAPEFSEDRLALRFTDRHGKDLRYVAEWGKWLAWTGTHWDVEKTLLALHLARNICREAASECNKLSEAKAIVKWKTVSAVETLARSDRRIAATVSQWDANQSFFNSKRKIGNVMSIELLTGIERDTIPEDYCTKIAGCELAPPGTPCPLWLAFLNTVMNKDKNLIDYLQRVCGYCMTGFIKEHAMFFLYGTGANGKSFLSIHFAASSALTIQPRQSKLSPLHIQPNILPTSPDSWAPGW